MTATEYNPDLENAICRVTDRTFPKIYEMYFLKGLEKEELPYKTSLKFERDVSDVVIRFYEVLFTGIYENLIESIE